MALWLFQRFVVCTIMPGALSGFHRIKVTDSAGMPASSAASSTLAPQMQGLRTACREAFAPIDGTQLNYIAGLRSGAATFEAGRGYHS